MVRYRVLPYKQGSKSAKALSEELGGKVLKLQGSTFTPKPDDIVINWGNSGGYLCSTLNDAGAIKNVSNKLTFLQRMVDHDLHGIIPRFWTQQEDIPDEVFPIVCRTVLNGHSGAGIVIADNREGLVPCSLYVQYLKKKDEYRVHVGQRDGDFKVIAVQRKARRTDHANPNWQIRNHANGFIFARSGFSTPEAVVSSALESIRASGLDFGAVDVIYNDYQEKAYVLEINTAPGLEGQTVKDYAEFFKSL